MIPFAMFLTIITAVRFVSFTIADLQIDYNLKVSDVWFVGEKVVNLKGHISLKQISSGQPRNKGHSK